MQAIRFLLSSIVFEAISNYLLLISDCIKVKSIYYFRSFPNCLVCLPNSHPGDLGRPRLFCANCLSTRKNILLKERKEVVTETKEKETKRKFYQVISCERRRNKRLGLKVCF